MKPAINDFWKDRDAWPLDPLNWVFFGRAIDRLAPLIEPEWEGEEFGDLYFGVPPWPAKGEPTTYAFNSALMTLVRHEPHGDATEALKRRAAKAALPPPIPPPSLASYPNMRASAPPEPQPEEPPPRALPSVFEAYQRARELERPFEEIAAARKARATKVQRRIVHACLREELETARRWESDGSLRMIPANWWNTEAFPLRFSQCKIDQKNPLQPSHYIPSKGDLCFLYVRETTLDTFASQFERPAPTEAAEWWPGPEARVTQWCRLPENAEFARARLRDKGNPGPLEAHLCRELAEMWNEARPDKLTKPESVKTMRASGR